jgi:hypothetical protein
LLHSCAGRGIIVWQTRWLGNKRRNSRLRKKYAVIILVLVGPGPTRCEAIQTICHASKKMGLGIYTAAAAAAAGHLMWLPLQILPRSFWIPAWLYLLNILAVTMIVVAITVVMMAKMTILLHI